MVSVGIMLLSCVIHVVCQKVVGRYDSPIGASGYDLKGDVAFVGDKEGGLLVVDYSNVSNATNSAVGLTLVGSYPGEDTRAVLVDGDVCYIIGKRGVLVKLDISTPASPVHMGGSTKDATTDGVALVTVPGSNVVYACIDAGVHVFDVSRTPKATSLLSMRKCNDIKLDLSNMRLHVVGLYIISPYYMVYSIDPTTYKLSLLGLERMPDITTALDLSSDGATAFITSRTYIDQVDVSDPSLSTWNIKSFDIGGSDDLVGVLRLNDLLFTSRGDELRVDGVDLPSFKPRGSLLVGGRPMLPLGLHENLLFMCQDTRGFIIVDISDLLPHTAEPTVAPTAAPTVAPPTVPPQTGAPRTLVPTPLPLTATPAPFTLSPATVPPAVPPTSVPTPVPATFIPQAAPPPTAVPAVTNVPLTNAPETEIPISSAPATLIPATSVPEVLAKEKEISTAGSAAAAGSVAAAGAAAGTATRLVVVSLGCNMNGKRQKLPRVLHPTQLEIWGSESVGLVVGNFAITFGFGLLCYIAFGILNNWGRTLLPDLMEGLDAQGLLRFPSAPMTIFQVLYQGTALGAADLIVHPFNIGSFVLGVVGMASCIYVPARLAILMVHEAPKSACYIVENKCGKLREVVLGKGEWVNTEPFCRWVQRHASMMRTYKCGYVWFFAVECGTSLSIALINVAQGSELEWCGHKKSFAALVFFAAMFLEAVLAPHARQRDVITQTILHGVQGVAMVLMAAGYYSEDLEHGVFGVASTVLMVAVGILLFKVAADVCSEAYILLSGRRTRLQYGLFTARDGVPLEEISAGDMDMDDVLDGTLSSADETPTAVNNDTTPYQRFVL